MKTFLRLYKRKCRFFYFQALQVTSWNIRSFLTVGFNFSITESYFLKYKQFSQGGLKISISGKIWSFFGVSVSLNIRNIFRGFRFLKLFNIWAKKFHFLKYKKFFLDFFYFSSLSQKVFLVVAHYTTTLNNAFVQVLICGICSDCGKCKQ